jgi:hypothetical protein
MYRNSLSRWDKSINVPGEARRNFIIGSKLWPPAITRASSSADSLAIASSTDVATTYSKLAGTCIALLTGLG